MTSADDTPDDLLRRRVRAAWAQILRVESFPSSGRGERVDERAGALSVVALWDGLVVLGPPWVVERTRGLLAQTLTALPTLLRLTADRPSFPIGAAALWYPAPAQAVPPGPQDGPDGTAQRPAGAAVVPDPDGRLSAALCEACPADDVAEVGLAEMADRFVAVDGDGKPLAGAGSVVWAGTLAHVGVLTHPAARGRGLGRLVAGAVADDALARGLVPQWRARADNPASGAVARALGLVAVGTQTTVRLP